MSDQISEVSAPRIGNPDRDAYWDDFFRQRFKAIRAGVLTEDDYVNAEKNRTLPMEKNAAEDPLTGLYNRRQIEKRLDQAIEEAKRSKLPLAALNLDLDFLKIVNDEHGHAIGDKTLIAFSNILKRYSKRAVAGRMGGEEFLMIFPNCTPEDVLQTAIEIGVAARMEVGFFANIPQLQTTSIGATMWKEGESAADFLNRADELMYEAKNGGRDRLVSDAGGKKETLKFADETDKIS